MSLYPELPSASTPFDPNPDPDTLVWLREQLLQNGDLFRAKPVKRRADSLIVNDAAAIGEVLKTRRRDFVKGVGFERVEMLLGNGIITSDGEQWRRQRTMIQPAFKSARIAGLHQVMVAAASRVQQRWREASGKPLNLTRQMSEFGLEVILRALFSDDYEELAGEAAGQPFAFLATEFERDLRFAHRFRKLTGPIGALIARRRASGKRPEDFVSMLMDAVAKQSSETMSDRELIDEITTLIVAGHETSAGTLNWALYELARHPELAARLRNEMQALPATPDAGALLQLDLARRVLDETLRLYPPVWLFSRKAIVDTELAGHPVAQGSNIFISPLLVQQNPRYWQDAASFDPDRFAGPPPVAHSFIPFSAGSRRCIGEHFSYLEMLTLLAAVIPNFELAPTSAAPVAIDAAINLRSATDILITATLKEDALTDAG